MATLYVMLGLPGSGKSYTARQLARRKNAEIYSSDSFRLQMHLNAENAKQNNDLFDLMYQKIREELDLGDEIIQAIEKGFKAYFGWTISDYEKKVSLITPISYEGGNFDGYNYTITDGSKKYYKEKYEDKCIECRKSLDTNAHRPTLPVNDSSMSPMFSIQ